MRGLFVLKAAEVNVARSHRDGAVRAFPGYVELDQEGTASYMALDAVIVVKVGDVAELGKLLKSYGGMVVKWIDLGVVRRN